MEDHKKFEEQARLATQKKFGVQLPSEKVNIHGKWKNFDLVNMRGRYVGDVKHYSYTQTGRRPSAKFSTLNEYVWILQKLGKRFTKFLVIGEDEQLVRKYVSEFKPWLKDVSIYFYKQGKKPKKII